MNEAQALADKHLTDPSSVWGIGAYGALAEFRRDADEPLLAEDFSQAMLATGRGAIRLNLDPAPAIVAYETLSAQPGRWLHGVAFTLSPDRIGSARRDRLTEIGDDASAILSGDREAVLFDLGLGAANIDVCVRTDDPDLAAALRRHVGHPVLGGDGRAMALIKEAHPHRVFASALGRIEVFAPIGSTKHNRPTPKGPHTHLLPQLLAAGRTHPATIDLAGGLPGLWLYPASPTHDHRGAPCPFEPLKHQAFQDLLLSHGHPDYVAEKRRVTQALSAAVAPAVFTPPSTRLGRAALRIAIRQLAARDGDSPNVSAWRAAFDPTTDNLTPLFHGPRGLAREEAN
ncbi:MAG: hypothetical protein O3A21_08795 [Proteobacteria bacterium]|nr:hypothetical protein [Pseudomonadota bacterium]